MVLPEITRNYSNYVTVITLVMHLVGKVNLKALKTENTLLPALSI